MSNIVAQYPDPDALKAAKFAVSAVFDRSPTARGDTLVLTPQEWVCSFAYKALTDMKITTQEAINILRFFRTELQWWDTKVQLILSLNDGHLAVLLTDPDCRKIYNYRSDMGSMAEETKPLPVPVVQASVNLARAFELEQCRR